MLFTILAIAQASALVVQQDNLYQGMVGNDGLLTTSTTPLTDVSVIGFSCIANDCSNVSGRLWNGAVLNSGNASRLDLVYPTTLIDNGYALFFYKTGYIPYKARVDLYGDGQASAVNRYLTKIESCWTNVSELSANYVDGKLIITGKVVSPLENTGTINYIPESLASEYSVDVQVKLNITGFNNYETTRTVNLKFSEIKPISFEFQTGSGNYNITLITGSQDAKCLSSQERTRTIAYTATGNIPNPNNDGNHGTSPTDKKEQAKKVINSEEIAEVDEYAEPVEEETLTTSGSSEDITETIALKSTGNETRFSWLFYLLGILSVILLVLIIILMLLRN